MVQVKICGINDPEALEAAADSGADWVGFVFYPPSPRAVTLERAAELVGRHAPPAVGLFVEPSDEELTAALRAVRLDALQIYASASRAAEIRRQSGVPVWHAIGVATTDDLPAVTSGVDRLIVEAKPRAGATRPGGNATRFDWALLAGWRSDRPWILAGGLTPDNVRDAVRITGASAVDVSSGVERAPGRKDPALIRRFISAARSDQLPPDT